MPFRQKKFTGRKNGSNLSRTKKGTSRKSIGRNSRPQMNKRKAESKKKTTNPVKLNLPPSSSDPDIISTSRKSDSELKKYKDPRPYRRAHRERFAKESESEDENESFAKVFVPVAPSYDISEDPQYKDLLANEYEWKSTPPTSPRSSEGQVEEKKQSEESEEPTVSKHGNRSSKKKSNQRHLEMLSEAAKRKAIGLSRKTGSWTSGTSTGATPDDPLGNNKDTQIYPVPGIHIIHPGKSRRKKTRTRDKSVERGISSSPTLPVVDSPDDGSYSRELNNQLSTKIKGSKTTLMRKPEEKTGQFASDKKKLNRDNSIGKGLLSNKEVNSTLKGNQERDSQIKVPFGEVFKEPNKNIKKLGAKLHSALLSRRK